MDNEIYVSRYGGVEFAEFLKVIERTDDVVKYEYILPDMESKIAEMDIFSFDKHFKKVTPGIISNIDQSIKYFYKKFNYLTTVKNVMGLPSETICDVYRVLDSNNVPENIRNIIISDNEMIKVYNLDAAKNSIPVANWLVKSNFSINDNILMKISEHTE